MGRFGKLQIVCITASTTTTTITIAKLWQNKRQQQQKNKIQKKNSHTFEFFWKQQTKKKITEKRAQHNTICVELNVGHSACNACE